jgi:antiviral helicase SKI2
MGLKEDGTKSDYKAFIVLALVTPGQKSGDEGEIPWWSEGPLLTGADVEVSQLAPRWPPVLPKGTFASPTWEVRTVDGGSISFVTDKLLKVGPAGLRVDMADMG